MVFVLKPDINAKNNNMLTMCSVLKTHAVPLV